ncbi:hypothetical protein [Thalassotalea ganghwensis]
MKAWLIIIIATLLMGCGSTPYRDDYTTHINTIHYDDIDIENLNFVVAGSPKVDLRGYYSSDDSVTTPTMLYAGDAGLIGLIAQVGIHSSIVQSQRDDRLSQLQSDANDEIKALRQLTTDVSLESALTTFDQALVEKENSITVVTKPIFFSTKDMSQIILNNVVWIPTPGKPKKIRYRNLVKVYAKPNNRLISAVEAKDTAEIQAILLELYETSLHIIKKDIQGQYRTSKINNQTFVISDNNQNKVIRGKLVDSKCQYNIVKDLHSWFIAIPKPLDEAASNPVISDETCNS